MERLPSQKQRVLDRAPDLPAPTGKGSCNVASRNLSTAMAGLDEWELLKRGPEASNQE